MQRIERQTMESDPLRALDLIETIGASAPFHIALVPQCTGSVMTPGETMSNRVKWATKARYTVLTRDVPERFAPHNAIIRVLGTEDYRADYLATLAEESAPEVGELADSSPTGSIGTSKSPVR